MVDKLFLAVQGTQGTAGGATELGALTTHHHRMNIMNSSLLRILQNISFAIAERLLLLRVETLNSKEHNVLHVIV